MNDFLTLQEVPALLKQLTDGKWDIQYRQVQKYARSGKLKSQPFGKSRYLVLPSDVEDFVARWKRGEVGKVGKPKLYTYIVATSAVDLNRERFTEECLKSMVDTPLPLTINVDFDVTMPVGEVKSLAYEVGKLLASTTVKAFAVVPMISYDTDDPDAMTEEGDVAVFHKVKVLGFGLTDRPSDPNCKLIV